MIAKLLGTNGVKMAINCPCYCPPGAPEESSMYAVFRPAFWLHYFHEFRCPYCGSLEGNVSRPRSFFERHGLKYLLLRPARCGECYRRCYVPTSVPLQP